MRIKMIIIGELLLVFLGCYFVFEYTTKDVPTKTSLLEVEEEKFNVTDIFIYGGKFNVEGYINKEVQDISLVWYENKEQKEEPIKIIRDGNKTIFYVSDKINQGINIDDMIFGNYKLLIKEKQSNNIVKYYTFNPFSFDELEYYTMHENHKIVVKGEENGIFFNVVGTKENIYDIILAPGHGGKDSGAINGNIKESDQVLEISNMVRKQLENEGYRVTITNTAENINKKTSDPYDENGEITKIYNSKAKYVFSIHLNSTLGNLGYSGVEIYVPNNIDLTLARALAVSIKGNAQTTYSNNSAFKIENGIYVRPSYGNEKYDVEVDPTITPFYYVLRETGGVITGSYNDGSSDYQKSLFYGKKVGVESYLLELGYIINDADLNNILNNKESYVKGIVDAIKQNIKKS